MHRFTLYVGTTRYNFNNAFVVTEREMNYWEADQARNVRITLRVGRMAYPCVVIFIEYNKAIWPLV